MNVNVTGASLERWLLKAAAIAAAVCSSLTSSTSGLPGNYRIALVTVGGVVYAVERVLAALTNTPVPPAPTTVTNVVVPGPVPTV